MKQQTINIPNLQAKHLSNAQMEGKQFGQLNKPNSLEEFNALYINQLEQSIQLEINKNNQANKPLSTQAMANKTQREKNDHVRKLQVDAYDKERETLGIKLQKEASSISFSDIVLHYSIYFIISLLALTEGYFIYQALIFSSVSIWMSILIGIAIACGLFMLTDIVSEFIQNANMKWKIWFRSILILILIFISFYLFGLLRQGGMAQESFLEASLGDNAINDSPLNAFTLAGLSTFIFGIGLLITMKYKPSSIELENMKEYRRIYFRLRKCKRELKKINQEIQLLNGNANNISLNAMNNFEDALHIEESLITLAYQCLHEFIKTNIKYRNGVMPDFFANPPKLRFQSFMNYSKSSNNQNEII